VAASNERPWTREDREQAALAYMAEDHRRRQAALHQMYRNYIENKARQAGRQDILEALPTTTDASILQGWLKELCEPL
jgi:hypothetical protein